MFEQPRFKITDMALEAVRQLHAVEKMVSEKVDSTLLNLVKVRASQINGCALCLEMHTDHALADGERPGRLTSLDAWRESPLYSDAERAALAWVDEVTLISVHHASSEAYEGLKTHFSEEEIGWLTLATAMINSWNRLAISSRSQYSKADAEGVKRMLAQPA